MQVRAQCLLLVLAQDDNKGLRVCRSVEPLCALALARAQDDAISINDLSCRPSTDRRSPSTAFLPAPPSRYPRDWLASPHPPHITLRDRRANPTTKVKSQAASSLPSPLLALPLAAFFICQPPKTPQRTGATALAMAPDDFALAGVGKHHTGTGMGQVYADQPPHQPAVVVHDYWQDIKAPASELA
ncbi:hypothetical protein B0H13DRAFT_2362082 [Mycena leptocephala]|nr:hypothetical protein B0H13DRAFT_2362082 [Mycena leptocephala]